MLAMEPVIVLGDGIGREKPVGGAFGGEVGVTLGMDLAVDDDVGDVHAFWPQLPRHALRQRPEPEFTHRQVDEPRPAPE